jgi:hypothetical protein
VEIFGRVDIVVTNADFHYDASYPHHGLKKRTPSKQGHEEPKAASSDGSELHRKREVPFGRSLTHVFANSLLP